MNAAILALDIAITNLEHNAPIHRAAGDTVQADQNECDAIEIRTARNTLKGK